MSHIFLSISLAHEINVCPTHQAIIVLRDSYGELDLRTAAVQHNLGSVYHQLQDLQNAEDCFSRAMQTRSRLLGKSHPESLFSKMKLARIKLEQKDVKAARKHALECSEILNEKGRYVLRSSNFCLVLATKTYSMQYRVKLNMFLVYTLPQLIMDNAFLASSHMRCCSLYFSWWCVLCHNIYRYKNWNTAVPDWLHSPLNFCKRRKRCWEDDDTCTASDKSIHCWGAVPTCTGACVNTLFWGLQSLNDSVWTWMLVTGMWQADQSTSN